MESASPFFECLLFGTDPTEDKTAFFYLGERISDHAVNIAKRSKKICKAASQLEEAALAEPLYSLADKLLHLIFVARSIERIGDLAVNIGEDAVFLSQARDIRHEHRKQP